MSPRSSTVIVKSIIVFVCSLVLSSGATGCGDDASNAADATATGDATVATTDGGKPVDSGATADGGGASNGLLPPSKSPIMTYCPFTDAADLDSFEGRRVMGV